MIARKADLVKLQISSPGLTLRAKPPRPWDCRSQLLNRRLGLRQSWLRFEIVR